MSDLQDKTRIVIPLGALVAAVLTLAIPWAVYVTVSLFQVKEDVAVIRATVAHDSPRVALSEK